MDIRDVQYTGSFVRSDEGPKDGKPEFAFIGRSNVGKSSLINTLCERRELAYISKKPGKTQVINYFLVNDDWYLVDLPGYGYARIARTMREQWEKMIQDYLLNRNTLFCALLLIDLNVDPQEIDVRFINWMGENRIPFVLVFTKADRLKAPEREANRVAFLDTLLKDWESLPPHFETSSVTGEGRAALLNFISGSIEEYAAG